MLLHLMDLLQLCKPVCQLSYVFCIVLAAHLIPNIPCLHSIPKVLHIYIIFLDCPLTHKLRHPSQQHTELQEQELTGLTVVISYLMRDMLRINGDQWGTKGAATGIGPESGIVDGESPSISLSYIDKESTNVRIQMQSCIY